MCGMASAGALRRELFAGFLTAQRPRFGGVQLLQCAAARQLTLEACHRQTVPETVSGRAEDAIQYRYYHGMCLHLLRSNRAVLF